ncbi:hypothetical protein MTO96_015143 [Rhipicephalus appendiculatus]
MELQLAVIKCKHVSWANWIEGCLNGRAQLRSDDGDSRALKRLEDVYDAVQCKPPGINQAVLDVYHDWLGLEDPLDGTGGSGDATLLRTTHHALEKTTNALNIRC